MDKDTLTRWAKRLEDGMDSVITADGYREGTDTKKYYWQRAMINFEMLRDEILEASRRLS